MAAPKTVVIFVQASRDIIYALHIIEQSPNCKIRLYIVDHLTNFEVLKKLLPSDISIKFIENYKFSNPFYVFMDAIRLRAIYFKELSALRACKVFFFSNYFDYKTFYLVSALANKNDVTLVDHYNLQRNYNSSLRVFDYIRKFVIWLVTFKLCHFTGEEYVPTFRFECEGIKKVAGPLVDKAVTKKYKTQIPLNSKSIILFDLIEPNLFFKNYESVFLAVIDISINSGF
jgi:hypothetical protein